jgi:tRNA threonylcarbamoyladenosine biosynthesis protein TsaE
VSARLSSLCASADATEALGRSLATLLEAGDVLLLVGGLGAGKTTFVRGLAAGLGYTGQVTSPTFTLCHAYDGRLRLVHADLWRLEREAEVADLALEEELEAGGVLVAEWGEAAETLFGAGALVVTFGPGRTDSERVVDLEPKGRSWGARNKRLRNVLEESRRLG